MPGTWRAGGLAMVNDLIEALASCPLVATDFGLECPWCGRPMEAESEKNFVHQVTCPVNQARLMLSDLPNHIVGRKA